MLRAASAFAWEEPSAHIYIEATAMMRNIVVDDLDVDILKATKLFNQCRYRCENLSGLFFQKLLQSVLESFGESSILCFSEPIVIPLSEHV